MKRFARFNVITLSILSAGCTPYQPILGLIHTPSGVLGITDSLIQGDIRVSMIGAEFRFNNEMYRYPLHKSDCASYHSVETVQMSISVLLTCSDGRSGKAVVHVNPKNYSGVCEFTLSDGSFGSFSFGIDSYRPQVF